MIFWGYPHDLGNLHINPLKVFPDASGFLTELETWVLVLKSGTCSSVLSREVVLQNSREGHAKFQVKSRKAHWFAGYLLFFFFHLSHGEYTLVDWLRSKGTPGLGIPKFTGDCDDP